MSREAPSARRPAKQRGQPGLDLLGTAIVEAAPDAMVIVNRDGVIELVNSQTERLLGYSRDELLGQTVDLQPEIDRAGRT